MSVKGYLGPTGANLIGADRIYAANGKIIATSGGTDGELLSFDSNGDVVAGPHTVDAFATANVLYVKNSNPGYGEFTSVAAALAAVTSPSATNPWIIDIGPGIYTEAALTVPAYVQLKGEATGGVILEPTVTTTAFITAAAGGSISRITVRGASGSGGIGVAFANGGSFDRFDVDNCVLRDCETLATVTGSSSTTVAAFRNCTLRGTFATGISVTASGGAGTQVLANGLTYNQPAGPAASVCVLRATGLCTLYVSDSIITQPGGVGIIADDSARLFVASTGFAGNATAISVPNVGGAPLVTINGMLVRANTVDINIAHVTCTGSIMGSFSPTNSTIASPDVSVFAADPNDGITFTGDVFFGPTYAERTAYTQLLLKAPTMGVLSGGALTDGGGFVVNVASGDGYYSSGDPVVYHSWSADTVTLSASVDHYIYFNSSGVLSHAANLPTLSASILLGRVVTNGSGIVIIDQANMQAHHTVNSNTEFFRKALGPVFESGCVVTENATGLHLNVTSGTYYLGPKKFEPSSGTNITWYRVYDGALQATSNAVDTANYNLNGAGGLIAMTGTNWTKHALYVSGDSTDQKYLMVQGQQQYASRAAAVAAPIPTPPSFMRDSVCPIAAIVTQRNDVDIQITQTGEIQDIRPRIGFSAATALSSSDHGSLTGLSDDDHTQYLLVSGTRAMAGSLNMGANSITAATTIGATGVITTTAASNQIVLGSSTNQLTINGDGSAAARTYTVPDNGTTSNFVVAGSTVGPAGEAPVFDGAGKLLSTAAGTAEINLVINPDALTALDGSRTNDVGDWIDSGTGTTSTRTTTTSEIPLYPFKANAIKIANDGSSTGYTYMRMTLPPALYSRKLKVQWEQFVSTGTAYVSGDYKVEVYTNAASDYSGAYTELALSTDSSGTSSIPAANGRYMTTFDTSTAPYLELRIVRVAGSASSFISLNNVVVGPGVGVQGAVVGAPESKTFTLTNAGNATVVGRVERHGVMGHFRGRVTMGSSAPTGLIYVNVPSGYTLDSTASTNNLGTGVCVASGLMHLGGCYYDSGTRVGFYGDDGAGQWNAASPVTWANGDTLDFDFWAPIAEWAGSGTVNLAQNDVEYAYNSSATTSTDSTTFGYGPDGFLIQNFAPAGTTPVSKRVRFSTPVQARDIVSVEIRDPDGIWASAADSTLGFRANDAGTTYTGVALSQPTIAGNMTDIDVNFYHEAVPGAAWSAVNAFRWRVRKIAGGQAVGFGEVVPGVSSGLVSASGLKGRDGVTVAASYVGEVKTGAATNVACAATTVFSSIASSITLTPGIWLVTGGAQFINGTIAGLTGLESCISLNSSSCDTSSDNNRVQMTSGLTNNPQWFCGTRIVLVDTATYPSGRAIYLLGAATFSGAVGSAAWYSTCNFKAVRIA